MALGCPRCHATLSSIASGVCLACLWTDDPFELDGFDIVRELGHGGMGTVYLARQLRLDRTVAIKVVSSDVAQRADVRDRFTIEAKVLARLKHPHIVMLHDYGERDGAPYLVMEHVEGQSLAKQVLPADEAIASIIQVCDALAYAHGQGVVHRDVKPSNILLDVHRRVKVVDFGIALLFRDDHAHRVTAQGVVVGTPHYLAPEVETGVPADPRSDIYSVGVVLFQLVTGRLPMGDLSLPVPGLEPIVRRALAPDPALRYQSADELALELRSLQRSSVAATIVQPVRRTATRRIVLGLAVVGAAATAIVFAALPRPAPHFAPGAPIAAARTLDALATPPDALATAVPSPADASLELPPPIQALPPTKRTPGTIVIRVRPWAEITIDGKRQALRAEPPLARYTVPPGRHRIELYNPTTDKRTNQVIEVTSGSERTVHADLR